MEGARYYIIRSDEEILSEEKQKYIEELIKSIKEDLEDFEQFVERVLEIKREQMLILGSWGTINYKLLLTYGGPNVWLETKGTLTIEELGNEIVVGIDDNEMRAKLLDLQLYLDDVLS